MDPPSSAPPTAAASQPAAAAELAAYADGEGGNRGRRNRVHPRNWGYTTYIDKVFSLRCFVNLVQLQVFPDAKDISESYGVLQAVIRKGLAPDGVVARGTSTRAQEKREGVLCFCIGDGSTARTATLASFLTNWHAVSVDPGLRREWAGKEPHGVRRLRGYAAKFEDVMADDGALRDILGDVLAAGCGGVAAGDKGDGASVGRVATAAGVGSEEERRVREEKEDNEQERGTVKGEEKEDEGERLNKEDVEREEDANANADGEAGTNGNKKRSDVSVVGVERDASAASAAAAAAAGIAATQTPLPSLPSEPEVLAYVRKKEWRQAFVDWLAGDGASQSLVDEQWGKVMHDPRRYPPAVLLAFWQWHQETVVAPAAKAAAAATASNPVKHLVLLGVHAHNRFRGAAEVEKVRAKFGHPATTVVSLPCCQQFNPTTDIGRQPEEDFEDLAIFSEKRRVLVWRWAVGVGGGVGL